MSKEIRKDSVNDLKEFSDEVATFKWLRVKYNNTPENRAIHDVFSAYAWKECDGGYLQAIKRLLELASNDWKYEALNNMIKDIEEKVFEMEQKLESSKKEEPKTF